MDNPSHPPELFPHGDLLAVATWLLGDLLAQPGMIVGSLRRCPDCAHFGVPRTRLQPRCGAVTKDIDLLVPGPGRDKDPFYGKLQKYVDLAADKGQSSLLPNERGSFIVALKGFKVGFKEASLMLDMARAERQASFPRDAMSTAWTDGPCMMQVPCQMFRYDPGAEGNMGWISLIRTGPNSERDQFGRACLARWKDLTGGKSDGGYPYDGENRKYPVPTEEAAFDLLQMRYIPPHLRTASAVPGWKRP